MTISLKREAIRSPKNKHWWHFDLRKNTTYDLTFIEISNPWTQYKINADTLEVYKAPGVYREIPKFVLKKALEMLR